MRPHGGRAFLILLVLIVACVIGFVLLFHQCIGPAIIDKVNTRQLAVQKDMSVKELEQTLSTYIELYESNMLIYNEYRKSASGEKKREASQYRENAVSISVLYGETYKANRRLAETLPTDVFPEGLE